MGVYHVVEQGEYLSMIAKRYGFAGHAIIWNHEKNADLKSKRENPNVLFPGDQLFIPDKENKKLSINTGATATFQVKRDKLKLRLAVSGLYLGPLENAEFEVSVDGEAVKQVIKDYGIIEVEVPPTAKTAELLIKEKGSDQDPVTIPIQIGHLDPVDTPSGQKARLNNLGYFAGFPAKEDEKLFRSAVEEFQCDQKLKIDGVCGANTQAKLKEAHGS